MLKPYLNPDVLEAGCDEAGRGCLAGPVVAAAVILPKDYTNKALNDSKKLSEKQRTALAHNIKEDALAYGIAICSPAEIDKLNILWASVEAMHRAINVLQPHPEQLLIDGNRFKKYGTLIHTCVVKGDATYQSIAAASILAKTYRDELMQQLHEEYPQYGWNKNMGYPTEIHRKAILEHGITPLHRKSFRLINLTLF